MKKVIYFLFAFSLLQHGDVLMKRLWNQIKS